MISEANIMKNNPPTAPLVPIYLVSKEKANPIAKPRATAAVGTMI